MRKKQKAITVATPSPALPGRLSPSRIKDWAHCELRFYFGAIERWRTPPTGATTLGNIVHQALEDLYRLPPGERTRARAGELLEDAFTTVMASAEYDAIRADEATMANLRERAPAAVDGLYELEDPTRVDVDAADLERWAERDLYQAPIRGRIDRTTRTPTWVVSDYKTGKVPAPRYVSGALGSMYTYAAVLAASDPGRRLPDTIELLYLLGPERISRPVVRDHLLGHARQLGETWQAITTAHAAGRYVARTGPLCGWCPFAPACPAVTADSPPVGSAEGTHVLTAAGLTRTATTPDPDRDPDRDAAEEAASLQEGAS
jgi:putative RecB family exonuclease